MKTTTILGAPLLLSFDASVRKLDPCMDMGCSARTWGALILLYTFLAWGAASTEFADGWREMLRAPKFYLVSAAYFAFAVLAMGFAS